MYLFQGKLMNKRVTCYAIFIDYVSDKIYMSCQKNSSTKEGGRWCDQNRSHEWSSVPSVEQLVGNIKELADAIYETARKTWRNFLNKM